MNRLFLFFTFLFCLVFHVPVWGQGRPITVTITVLGPNPNLDAAITEPYTPIGVGCEVYLFPNANEARKYYNAMKQMDSEAGAVSLDTSLPVPKDTAQTDANGTCRFDRVNSTSWVVAYQYNSTRISKAIPLDGRTEITMMVEQNEHMLQEVETKGKRKKRKITSRNFPFGDHKVINIDVPIDAENTNATFRYGISPFSTVIESSSYGFTSAHQKRDPIGERVFKEMRPFVIDGEAFDRTQYRKMGYDEGNDPLAPFVDRTQRVKTRDVDNDSLAFHIREVLAPVSQDAFYPTYGYLWYENYGNLVVTDTLFLDAGFQKNPMRFLDFSFPQMEIDKDRYKIREEKEEVEGGDTLNIEFVNGKAEVLPTDTVGLHQLELIVDNLEDICETGELYNVQIKGFASPEGGRTVNESLCRQRADYIRRRVISRLPGGVSSSVEGTVASWTDVANLLRADSLADRENLARAAQIDEIVSTSKDQHQIDARMAASPLAKFLKENEEKYYKPLRKVDIKYSYTLKRILTRAQVIDLYERVKKDPTFPYQYAYLFDYLKDRPKELERLAKEAVRTVKFGTLHKPWPLAAYYLAKCYASRDTCDVALLKPYLKKSDEEAQKEVPRSRLRATCSTLLNAEHLDTYGSLLQVVNDEAIVLQQISMLVKANKLTDAFEIAGRLLPSDSPQYALPQTMLECLAEGWNLPEVRDRVAISSPWNKVVVYAAQDADPDMDEVFWDRAWELLNDTTVFHLDAPRELYMKGILAHRLYVQAKHWNERSDGAPVPKRFFDLGDYSLYDHPVYSDENFPWGAVMVRACEQDGSFINILKLDDEFRQNYRDGFAAYWNEKHPDNILE